MTSPRLRALDHQHLWHPFTPMSLWLESEPLVITAAEGFHLIDSDGRRFLDGVSSLWCNVHGHRVPEIDQAIIAQLGKVAHTTMLGLANEPSILLAQKLIELAPPGLEKVFYSDAGATATEIAFKLAVQYWYNSGKPEKREFIAFNEAYHGDTFGAISVGRMEAFHRPYLPMLFDVHFAPTPFVYRWRSPGEHRPNAEEVKRQALVALTDLLEKTRGQIAAICIEPIVQGAGGIITHPPGFLAGVRALADEFETLLICDEVATGFARTGKMFACQHENVSPDLMTLAKGLTGGYLPLAATLTTQKIFDAFLGHPSEGKTFYHGHTYTGNPLACAAAIANLNLMAKRNTAGNVARNEPILADLLKPLKHLPHVGEIRQRGYMVGIELVQNKQTRQPFDPARRLGAEVCQRIRSHGVIIRPLGDVVVLMPPPAMGVDDLRVIVEAVSHEIAAIPTQWGRHSCLP